MSHAELLLAAYLAAAGVLTLTPGVDTAMILRTSTAHGARSGAAAACGIGLGCLVWGAAAAFGLTAVLTASTLAFTILKWAGGGWLVWMGAKLLWKPRRGLEMEALFADAPTPQAAFRRGLLTNLLNPKVGVFYMTFLPQFIPAGADVARYCLMLASIHVVMGLAWSACLIALSVRLGAFLRRPAVVTTMDRLTGAVFVGFGLKLALMEQA